MQITLEGGCVCGAIRFQCHTSPLAMYNCHCRGCQKISGVPYLPLLVMESEKVDIMGEQTFFKQNIEGDRHLKHCICKKCGSVLFSFCNSRLGFMLVNALALDRPETYRPIADIWTVDLQPGVILDLHIPKVLKSPPLLGNEFV